MNFYDLSEHRDPAPQPKTALTTANTANVVKEHLESLGLGVLFGKAGVYVTGSRVWKLANGLTPAALADVDIILIGDEEQTSLLRVNVIEALNLSAGLVATGPSMTEDRELATLPGIKYLTQSGLTVDIWGMANIHKALQGYPEHSHASSRMAWDCENGCLLMYPNSQARAEEAECALSVLDLMLVDPEPVGPRLADLMVAL